MFRTSGAVIQKRLIIFTRYPEPGKTKTRLISVLGAEGAAQLHREMTEYTLAHLIRLKEKIPLLAIEVRFTGGNQQLMQNWLGDGITYESQGDGDLGVKMSSAFQEAFTTGIERVIIIGTDCPEIDCMLIQEAFERLDQADLVLGPAHDGGYYLIGLSRFVPELLIGIKWGTAEVRSATIAIANQLGLSLSLLPLHGDVDRPEDLPIWEQAKTKNRDLDYPKISLIIPVLNEGGLSAESFSRRLTYLINLVNLSTNIETIIVDGGSTDNTVEIANSLGVKVVKAPTGRATQMNIGAQIATGEILLFLHVDTQLPLGFDAIARQLLAQPGVVVGAFQLKIDAELPGLRLIEMAANCRSRCLGLPYGDQGIFLSAKIFRALGGFPELPIMEDFALIKRLQRLGQIAIAPISVLTSARRWQKLGVFQTTLINQVIVLGYYLGISPKILVRWYRQGFW